MKSTKIVEFVRVMLPDIEDALHGIFKGCGVANYKETEAAFLFGIIDAGQRRRRDYTIGSSKNKQFLQGL